MGQPYSQVLLKDEGWIQRCTAGVPTADFGVEWAPGDGALTVQLVERWDYTAALEIDARLARTLRNRLDPDRLGVVRADAVEYPLPARPEPYPLVGSLPYHVTGPLLIRILRAHDRIGEFQGMVQWEVARRLAAEPGDGEYRGITLLFRWMGEVELRHRVPADAFRPAPRVDSAWILYRPSRSPGSFEAVRRFVRRCFRHPRKTLINNLTGNPDEKTAWRNWMQKRGWDPRRRPATLHPDELEVLYEAWTNRGSW